MALNDASPQVPYDEFGLFHENASEFGLPLSAAPVVRRVDTALAGGRVISALQWGDGAAQLVFLQSGADDVAVVVEALAPDARAVVGMSFGGITAACLAVQHPRLVRRLVMVDVTPGVTPAKAKAITDFINGPQTFASFDDLLARTIEHNPTRTESSLRRGILHNAAQLDDGTWTWRYDRRNRVLRGPSGEDGTPLHSPSLWEVVGALACPLMLVRGSLSAVIDDDDVAEMRRRQPGMDYHVVEGAGHSIQGDRPLELAELIRSFALAS